MTEDAPDVVHPNAPACQGGVLLVLMTRGAGLSVEQFEEHVETQADGSSATDVFKATVYRDSVGRMRTDSDRTGDRGEALSVGQLVDPVAGFIAILLPAEKTAHRMNVPDGAFYAMRSGFNLGKALRARDVVTINEDLGRRTIDTVEYQGTRTVVTSEQPAARIIRDVWLSEKLGLIGLVEAAGPDWRHIARIENLDVREPDPARFVIPAGYVTQTLE